MLRAVRDYFIGPHFMQAEPDELRRVRLAVGMAMALTSLGITYTPIFLIVLGNPLSAIGAVGVSVLALLALFCFRIRGNFRHLANADVSILLLTHTLNCSTTGGIESPLLSGYLVMPLAATLLMGRKSGQLWGVVSILCIACFGVVESTGIASVPPYPHELGVAGRVFLTATIVLVAMIFIMILQFGLEQTLRVLHQRNLDVAQALRTLKAAQSELVHHEKMSSLGQLTAGIAHEINNPINFVSSSIAPLRRDIEQIQSVVERYASIDLNGTVAAELADVDEFKQDVEYDELSDEIKHLLQGIEDGANRTSEIIRGLRTFSRLDEDVLKPIDLHDCIDSTVVLLQHRCGDRIEIVREYGEVPNVDCFPGQINQVLMNVITNAIQAIPDRGRVTVQTRTDDINARISITDSGVGMNDSVRSRIFEPFYTTRDVGKGTGLGLSISQGIIDNHKGSMSVSSAEGMGSTFHIDLPIIQSVSNVALKAEPSER